MIRSPESSTMFLIRPIPVKHVVKNVHRITQQQKSELFILYFIQSERTEKKTEKFGKKKFHQVELITIN